MNFLPTVWACRPTSQTFVTHLTLSGGNLTCSHTGLAADPAFEIHCQPDLISEVRQALPEATVKTTDWRRYDADLARTVPGTVSGKNSDGGSWGMGTVFHIFTDGTVTTGHFQGMTLLEPAHEEALHAGPSTWNVADSTTDEDRLIITRWLESHGAAHNINPNRADASAITKKRWDDLYRKFEEQVDARFRPQLEDTTPVRHEPVDPTPAQCRTDHVVDGRRSRIIRLRAIGLSNCDDWSGTGNFESCIRNQGGTIDYYCPAVSDGFVGTLGGPLHETRYSLPDGTVRYAYIINHNSVDDWYQEIWTSDIRLSAAAAADTIAAARKTSLLDLRADNTHPETGQTAH